MAVMPGQSRLGGRNVYCAFHAKQEMQVYDSKAVSQEVLGPLDDFRSACAINRALGKLFTVTVQNRIPVRNAMVLAYIAQLMLRTLHPLRNELIETGGANGLDVILRDIFALFDGQLDKDRPARPGEFKSHRRQQIEDGLAVLRAAGLGIPPALARKAREAVENESDEEDQDEGQDHDQEEGDDNNEGDDTESDEEAHVEA